MEQVNVDRRRSYGLAAGWLSAGRAIERQSKQAIDLRRQDPSCRAGWVLALMMLEAAPTPCSRTGFHMSNISL